MIQVLSETIDGVEVLSTHVGEDKRLLRAVRKRLSEGSRVLLAREIPKRHLMSAIIASMEWDFRSEVVGISYDHWGGVRVECRDDDSFRIWVEWHATFEEGLAAAWWILADRFSEKLIPLPG